MTDSLLRSLREHMLNESEPLAGLLRKCLLLGAETGSTALRDWARKELNGYDDDDEIPDYRTVPAAISVDSMNGNNWITGQIINRLQMPKACQEYVPEAIPFVAPIEQLEQMAGQGSLSFTNSGLAYAQTLWNRELGPYRGIVNISYTMPGSAIAGILGQIRTQLVDIIADLTADTPLAEVPGKTEVDAAVRQRITQTRDVYHTTTHQAGGPFAIGTAATASSVGLTIDDALKLLEQVRELSKGVDDGQREELIDAIAELRAAVTKESPDTGDVVKKAGALRAVGEKVGVASVSAAVSSAVHVIVDLALSGALG